MMNLSGSSQRRQERRTAERGTRRSKKRRRVAKKQPRVANVQPFFAKLEDLWRWQLEQLGPPSSWPADERAELEPFYVDLRARLGLTE